MATDFQKIEVHDVDIENFSYDVSDMVDNIYIGPQGELLEKLQQFNHNFRCNISVTKAFTLKPGGYDELKKAYARWVLRYDLKPRGIKSLFDRIRQYGWRLSQFQRDILDIENRMKTLKRSGMRWQDNTEQFDIEFERFKENVINQLAQLREMYPNIGIFCKIIPVSEGRLQVFRRRGYWGDRSIFPQDMFSDNVVDFVFMIYVKLNNPTMTVHIMDDGGTSEYSIPMEDILIASGTYLLPMISRNWGRTTPLTGVPPTNAYSFFLEAMYLSKMRKSEHPYIGRGTDTYNWELNGRCLSGNICTGNMSSDIRNSLINNEIMAHVVHLINWVTTYYVPQTNPLNRINRLRNFGDDIQFRQWRGDLNSTSSEVFRSGIDNLPQDCNFGQSLLADTISYASNEDSNSMYSDRNLRFNESNVEWSMRLHEYLNMIEIDEMPCINCSFRSECTQYDILHLIFQDSLTPEEESKLGMLYEYHDYNKNVLSRADEQDYREVHYIEMAMEEAWRWKLEEEHFRMVMAHKMCIWWSYCSNQIFDVQGYIYRRRMQCIHGMRYDRMKHLFEQHYLNEDSEFAWSLDNIRAYRYIEPDDRLDKSSNEGDIDTDETVRDWFESTDTDTDILPFSDPPITEDMTPEQRAIQWAIQHGGANNL